MFALQSVNAAKYFAGFGEFVVTGMVIKWLKNRSHSPSHQVTYGAPRPDTKVDIKGEKGFLGNPD